MACRVECIHTYIRGDENELSICVYGKKMYDHVFIFVDFITCFIAHSQGVFIGENKKYFFA